MTATLGFFDASCPQCRKRFGWSGHAIDRPACPRCGYQIPAEERTADARQLEDFRELLAELRQANPGWDKWQKARVAAGLTLRQAAKLLGMMPSDLSAVEQGGVGPSPELLEKMKRVYGVGE